MTFRELVLKHAPDDWEEQISSVKLEECSVTGNPLRVIVFSADIRASTLLMKESMDFRQFAFAFSNLFTIAAEVLRAQRGWFDKFTGDGFLAYWIVDGRHEADYAGEVTATCRSLMETFENSVAPTLRATSRNFPAHAGISVGLDSGPAHFVEVAGDLTVVGHPVVGAVRMVSAAKAYETLVNVHLAERWLQRPETLGQHNVTLTPETRDTKEFTSGQLLYKAEGFQRRDRPAT